jgi:uncharacterized protein (TIGR00725 family)
MPRPARWIGVVGPGSAAVREAPAAEPGGAGPVSGATPEELAAAEEVGAGIAAAGAILVCGGLGGVMEAACRGARSRGGVTVGLLPGLDRSDANGWVTLALPTGLGELRNGLIVRSADALIAVGGGWGTLSEIALALRAGLPVIGLGTWQPARGGEPVDGILHVPDAASAVAEALRLLS